MRFRRGAPLGAPYKSFLLVTPSGLQPTRNLLFGLFQQPLQPRRNDPLSSTCHPASFNLVIPSDPEPWRGGVEGSAVLERLRLPRRSTQPQCPITSTPPIPLWFFRIITLQTISRHCIDSQWFTSIFFYCNSYSRILPPARNLGKNEPSQLAVAQQPFSATNRWPQIAKERFPFSFGEGEDTSPQRSPRRPLAPQ